MRPAEVTIPGLELQGELGHGVHSVVYAARRNGASYAVKLPLQGETGAKAKLLTQRFLREAVALARVPHPALPAVLEVGQVERVPYVVMEFVSGETLAERLRRGVLSEPDAVQLGRQLADALAQIHAAGLVHRDVNPKNILFDARSGAVRLVDFGFSASWVAGMRAEASPAALAYTAPEQFSAARERVDGRADLYSVGCVLFECLAGSPPFSDLDPKRLLHQHANLPAPDPEAFARRVSRPLAALLFRLLARNPDERCLSADILREDLQRLNASADGHWTAHDRGAAHGDGAPGPMIGREPELARLRGLWDEAKQGASRVLVIRGAPGSGKTRLVDGLLAQTRQEPTTAIVATCQQIDPKPFSTIRQLLEAHLQSYDALPAANRLRAIARLRTIAGDLAPLLAVISPALARVFENSAAPHPAEAQHLFAEGLADFLGKLLLELGPTVVVVDDLQWIDESSRRVLARIIDKKPSSGVLYVLTTRAESEGSSPPEQWLEPALRRERATVLDLGCLPEFHVVELVQAYLGNGNVAQELLRYVTGLSDGTPLSVLEILRTMLEAGVLVPYWGTWQLDRAAVAQMELPGETAALLARRIEDLDSMTVTTLTAAAVVGKTFDDVLLQSVCELEAGHVNAALAEARRALLIVSAPRGAHRFLHDSMREALLRRIGDAARRALHQSVAEALDAATPQDDALRDALQWNPVLDHELASAARELDEELAWRPSRGTPSSRVDFCYAVATHYLHGERDKYPDRVYRTSVVAGKLAFRSFDNERALVFFDNALAAARSMQRAPDPELYFIIGEAHLRAGALEDSLKQFSEVVEAGAPPLLQGLTLSRVAWVQLQLDSAQAWAAAERAFQYFGVPSPSGSIAGVLVACLQLLFRALVRVKPAQNTLERRRLEGICALHYLTARLALMKPLVIVEATLRSLVTAQQLGPSPALARSYLMFSFMLTVLGLRGLGRKYLAHAEEIARGTGDPAVIGHALQVHSVVAAWGGDMRGAIEAGAPATEEYGHWRELSDFCMTAYNLAQIEVIRGRNLDAWKWIDCAIQRLGSHERAPMVLDFLELSARATLTALGRQQQSDELLERLRSVTVRPSGGGVLSAPAFGARLRLYTESGDLGVQFTRIVDEVRSVYPNARKAHIEVSEFYVHAAHARVHLCLRANDQDRSQRLEELNMAIGELEQVTRSRLLKAHLRAVQGYAAWFHGEPARAERCFVRAEALGRDEGAPWVLYSVCRARAFMLRAAGKHDSARDQAKLAETLARDNGSYYRLRWIRDEFGLRGEGSPERPLTGLLPAMNARASGGRQNDAHASQPEPKSRRAAELWHQERNGRERKTVVP